MNARTLIALALAVLAALLSLAEFALADDGVYTLLSAWAPGRVVLGVAAVVLAASLARTVRD